jgi:ferrous iron transport protein B
MMELPVYQRPAPRVVFGQVISASREFLVTAGTIIMATAVVIWVLSYYPRPSGIHEAHAAERAPHLAELATLSEEAAERASIEATLQGIDARERAAYMEQSILAEAGKAIQPIFEPAGFDWRTTVGVLSAFPARELVIPTLGILYGVGDVDPGDFEVASLSEVSAHRDEGLVGRLRAAKRDDGTPAWSTLSALAVMVFFALCSQCMATLAAIKRETRSWRWPIFVFTDMTAFAWVLAVLVYQVGSALGLGGTA